MRDDDDDGDANEHDDENEHGLRTNSCSSSSVVGFGLWRRWKRGGDGDNRLREDDEWFVRSV